MPALIANQGVLQFTVFDAIDGERVCEFDITPSSLYSIQEDSFHTFLCVDDKDNSELYGVSFADGAVGRQAGKIVRQLITPMQEEGEDEGCSETDAGDVTRTGKRLFRNIRRFFTSRRHDEMGQCRNLEISAPSNFQHVSHVGSGPLMYTAQEDAKGEGNKQSSTSSKRGPPQDQASQTKKKKIEISGPMDFRHVVHLGESQFGEGDAFSLPKDKDHEEEEGVDRGKRNSSVQSGNTGGVRPDISAPFDPKHIAHVSKSDPIVHLLTAQGKKDPFVGASVTAGMPSEPPEKPPRVIESIKTDQSVNDKELPRSSASEGEAEDMEQNSSKKEGEKTPLETAGQQDPKSLDGRDKPLLAEEEPQKSTVSSDWSTISQTSDNVSLGTLLSQESREEGNPQSTSVGTQVVSRRERKDSWMQTDPVAPSPPPPNPPPPPAITPPMRIPPPLQFNHEEFLEEIQAFKPSLLKNVALRQVSDRSKAPAINRLSMQTMMRMSFDKMKDKLHSVWRESIFAYIPEEDEFDDEEDYDFASLVY